MKVLCFILSLYVLCLAAMPCCADGNCNDAVNTTQTDNQTQDDDCNACSPFFSCGACAGSVFMKPEFTLKVVPFANHKIVDTYTFGFVDQFLAKIWQPPKMS